MLTSLGTNFCQNRFINGRDTAFVDLQDGGESSTSGFGFFSSSACVLACGYEFLSKSVHEWPR